MGEPDPEKIAAQIKGNSTKCKSDKSVQRKIKSELKGIKSLLQENPELDHPFTAEELNVAIGATKVGKAAGLDGMYPEFVKHLGNRARIWLLKFCNKIFKSSNLPPLLMRANIVAILTRQRPDAAGIISPNCFIERHIQIGGKAHNWPNKTSHQQSNTTGTTRLL